MRSYLGYWAAQRLAVGLPLPAAYWVAEHLADLQAWRAPEDRAAVEANLALIQEGRPADLPRLRQAVFRGFARYLFEFLRLRRLDRATLDRWVRLEGRGLLDAARAQGRGVIVVSAHLGNWELGAAALAVLGYPVTAVALEHGHPRVDELFVRQRERLGMEVVPLGGAMRRCLAALEAGRIVALVGDRNYGEGGVAVRLLGRTLLLPRGPAWLSLHQQAPIIPAFVVRTEPGAYRFIFEPALTAARSGREEADVQSLLQAYAEVLERYVRAYPTQWCFFRRLGAEAAGAAAHPHPRA
ncbi:MAG: lysophospholipid acyltransferase family protein [Candidatus Omnitrophica bacterium]|nr:lysophospholipid acyltransferase family protein [Candidatus Omnitrophota bacterium]